jgi:hypothetical protein
LKDLGSIFATKPGCLHEFLLLGRCIEEFEYAVCLQIFKTTDIAYTKYNNRGARYPTNAKKRYNDTSTKEK